MSEHDEDGYTGGAELIVGEQRLSVSVELRGHFQPIDGRYRWYGRVAHSDELHALLAGKKTQAHIELPDGSATGQLSDPDPWGRYRIMGSSTPPFRIPTSLAEIEGEQHS